MAEQTIEQAIAATWKEAAALVRSHKAGASTFGGDESRALDVAYFHLIKEMEEKAAATPARELLADGLIAAWSHGKPVPGGRRSLMTERVIDTELAIVKRCAAYVRGFMVPPPQTLPRGVYARDALADCADQMEADADALIASVVTEQLKSITEQSPTSDLTGEERPKP